MSLPEQCEGFNAPFGPISGLKMAIKAACDTHPKKMSLVRE